MRRAGLRTLLFELARPDGRQRPAPAERPGLEELDRLCALAECHGVLPAVLHNLAAAADAFNRGSPDAFASMMDRRRRRAERQVGFSLLLRGRSVEILKSLSEAGVPHMVLKGPEFADRLYPDAALRPFTDLDLLVPRQEMSAAATAMTELGYVFEQPPGLKHAAGYGEQTWAQPGRTSVKVEIHWNVVNSPSVRRGVSVAFEDLQLDREALTPARPSPASLLLIAAVHGAAGHAFERLQTLCDVRQAAAGAAGEIDEYWLSAAARRTGAALSLSVGLGLAATVFEDWACRRLAERFGRGLRFRLARLLLTRAMVAAPPHLSRLRRQAFRELLKFGRKPG